MKDRRGLPSDEYWRERAEDRLTEAEKLSVPYLEDIHAVYDDARLKIVEDIKNLYKNYYKDNEGFDQEKLRVIIPNGDLERFHREMKKAGLSEYLPDNYKARMTRLEYLYADCWAESKKASLKHQQIETKAHRETIQNAYYKTIYDTGVGLKINPAFSRLDNRAVNQVLNTKFLGGNYSERIWKNTDKLANTLKEVIGSAIARGESYSKTARGIRERFGVTQYEATRLVQTETCYFQNQAEIEALKTMGIEKYKFIATLDSRTSDICRDHDKKVYNIEDAKAGENLPPLHPNCRSTVSAYLGEKYESAIRIARNENGENEYVDNEPYNEWLKKHTGSTLKERPNTPSSAVSNIVGSNETMGVEKYSTTPPSEELRYLKEDSGIEFLKVNKLTENIDSDQIIKKVGGGDRTTGSCASVALAYVGNRLGYDVLDFRGGKSRSFFSVNAKQIIKEIAIIREGIDGHKTGYSLLKTMVPNKEYYFGIGKHVAIVRLNDELKKWQYLELQSPEDNGWKTFTKNTLKERFGCPRTQTKYGLQMPIRGYLAEIEAFEKIEGFSDILGYINTSQKSQLKGKTGRIL